MSCNRRSSTVHSFGRALLENEAATLYITADRQPNLVGGKVSVTGLN